MYTYTRPADTTPIDTGYHGLGGQQTGSRDLPASATRAPKAAKVDRYATGTEELSARIAATSRAVGRVKFAEWVSTDNHKVTPSAVWRAERNKLHASEVDFWKTVDLDTAPVREAKAPKADARLDTIRDLVTGDLDKVTKKDLIARLLDIVN